MDGNFFDELTVSDALSFEAIGSAVVALFFMLVVSVANPELKVSKEAKTIFSPPPSAAPIEGFSALMELIAPEPCLAPPIKNLIAVKFIAKLTRRNKSKLRLSPLNMAATLFEFKRRLTRNFSIIKNPAILT
jgi:hypothetical protein